MKSILYILIFSFCSSILPSKELAKLPFMIEHFHCHKKLDSTLSILDFIELHYTDCQNLFGDEKEDMKLPFKSNNKKFDLTNFQFFEFQISKIQIFFSLGISNFKKQLFYFINPNFSKAILKLLQPPKL